MRKLLIILLLSTTCLMAEEEGKIYIRSNPSEARVFILMDKTDYDFIGKTGEILKVPQGEQKFLIVLDDFENKMIEIDIRGTQIHKPEAIDLEPITYDVDIIFLEDGWQIIANEEPLTGEDGEPITAPATIQLAKGEHKIQLRKNEFEITTENIIVKENIQIKIENKPRKIPNKKEQNNSQKQQKINIEAIIGIWKFIHDCSNPDKFQDPIKFNRDGTITFKEKSNEFSWRITNLNLEILNKNKQILGRFNFDLDLGGWKSPTGQTDTLTSHKEMQLIK